MNPGLELYSVFAVEFEIEVVFPFVFIQRHPPDQALDLQAVGFPGLWHARL